MVQRKSDPNPLVLNPDVEFESAIIDIVRMHRLKSKAYGTEDDSLNNFYDGAEFADSTPLRECEGYMRKHLASLKNWWRGVPVNENPVPTKYSDDGYLDRAVYSIIALVLYKRMKAGR